MATRKSRTDGTAGSPAGEKPVRKKSAVSKAAADATGEPTAVSATAKAKPAGRAAKAKRAPKPAAGVPEALGVTAKAPARRGRFGRPAAAEKPEAEVDEAAIEASLGDKASGKNLVVVESPTKSKTLNKFLGKDFMVLASNGHVMDLPKSKLGVDVDNDFEPMYEPIHGKKAVLAKIRIAARHAGIVYLAPDPDREGEAIAWHLASQLKGTKRPVRRLTFNEITQRAVTEALKNPRDLDMNLVNAQQARRVLDRLIGYKVSPFVWSTVKYGLAAGRVQSVALRLICDREEEIRAFVPEEYWTIEVDYATPSAERFTARLVRVDDEKLE
ncbi:MAG TPA: DNA topoisomerase, partial [Methylomirabilota bacterium]|nr:DNA topoisomerase [Methylomirabilota bacterium]